MSRFTAADPILGKPRGSIKAALDYATAHGAKRPEFVAAYVHELWRLCRKYNVDFAFMFGHACNESDVFRSPIFEREGNTVGLGKFDDGSSESRPYANGVEAARAHFVHLWAYSPLTVPASDDLYGYVPLDPRYDNVIGTPLAGSMRTWGDLGGGRWATDPNAAAKAIRHATAAFAEGDTVGNLIVARKPPIEYAILPAGAPNNPNLPMPDPSFVTVHEVGNLAPGANEDMHRDFVHNGGGSANVSFQGIVGPVKFIQLMYLNRAAWHGSDGYYGRGNRDSFAIETVQVGDFERTLSHLAWIIAELFRNPKAFKHDPAVAMIDDLPAEQVKERVKQHNYWAPDRKNCPQFIRDQGRFDDLLNAVVAELGNPDANKYKPGIVPDFWSEEWMDSGEDGRDNGITYHGIKRSLRVKAGTEATAYRNGLDRKAGETRPPIKPGEQVIARAYYRTKEKGGVPYIISKFGSHIRASNLTPYIRVG